MKKAMLGRGLAVLGLLLAAMLTSGCATTRAREQALTGETQHERHASGIDSQVGDN